MYAIIQDGGRQYKVTEGQTLDLDYRDVPAGETFTIDSVLAVSGGQGIKLGEPMVAGASVEAEVVGPRKGEKLIVQKFTRRQGYRRKNGHRQLHTRVIINKIVG